MSLGASSLPQLHVVLMLLLGDHQCFTHTSNNVKIISEKLYKLHLLSLDVCPIHWCERKLKNYKLGMTVLYVLILYFSPPAQSYDPNSSLFYKSL